MPSLRLGGRAIYVHTPYISHQYHISGAARRAQHPTPISSIAVKFTFAWLWRSERRGSASFAVALARARVLFDGDLRFKFIDGLAFDAMFHGAIRP